MSTPLTHSTSPVTGIAYPLPARETDATAIDSFLRANAGKQVVVIQGLGFVGAVMAIVCANAPDHEYAVIGVDLATPESWWRIQSLNDGEFPLTAGDPQIQNLFAEARSKGNFLATWDPAAYAHAEIVVVDVNLDVKKSATDGLLQGYDVDLTGFRRAIAAIAEHCREDCLVIVETTVPPGTCEKVVGPVLREGLATRGLRTDRIRIGHSYERIMPGPDYVESIRTFPRVYAGMDTAGADATEAFLRTIIDTARCPLTRLASTTASEMAKVLENSYRAMNIAFVVEWTRFAEEAGVDLYSVVHAIRKRPTHANLMLPGIGVGGYCLTKDPLLASWSRQALAGGGTPLSCSVEAVRINDQMPTFAFRFLERAVGSLSGKSVLLLGVAYRGDVGDTRFSPVDSFYDHLCAAGARVIMHDPYVRHWSEKDRDVFACLDEALASAPAIVVISAAHRDYREEATIARLLASPPCLVFDTLGLMSDAHIRRLQARHSVKVLGRGDL